MTIGIAPGRSTTEYRQSRWIILLGCVVLLAGLVVTYLASPLWAGLLAGASGTIIVVAVFVVYALSRARVKSVAASRAPPARTGI
jgi:hypothetical protein